MKVAVCDDLKECLIQMEDLLHQIPYIKQVDTYSNMCDFYDELKEGKSYDVVFMDYLGLNLTSRIVGNYDLLVIGSNFNMVAVCVSTPIITTGMFLLTKMWGILKSEEWKITRKEWPCVMLPVSQMFWLWHMIIVYSVNYKSIPVLMLIGSILGLAADIYMLVLFVNLNKKNEAERQLKELNHLYQLEQMRYEQLKENQEEAAKIRHDFQNYILALKQME